jgi:AcrR family transcriptional regulator
VAPAPARKGVVNTRDAILRATLEVVGEQGVGGLTNRRIVAAAGVSLGTLTYHFPSQTELLREAMLLFAEEETAKLAAIADAHSADGLSLEQARPWSST